jgi:hypothetical protein
MFKKTIEWVRAEKKELEERLIRWEDSMHSTVIARIIKIEGRLKNIEEAIEKEVKAEDQKATPPAPAAPTDGPTT